MTHLRYIYTSPDVQFYRQSKVLRFIHRKIDYTNIAQNILYKVKCMQNFRYITCTYTCHVQSFKNSKRFVFLFERSHPLWHPGYICTRAKSTKSHSETLQFFHRRKGPSVRALYVAVSSTRSARRTRTSSI